METLKEFEELYQNIIPSLNECGNCNVVPCQYCFFMNLKTCSNCRRIECYNCKMFRKSKWRLFEKCSAKQWNYVINFLHDSFRISGVIIDFFLSETN